MPDDLRSETMSLTAVLKKELMLPPAGADSVKDADEAGTEGGGTT